MDPNNYGNILPPQNYTLPSYPHTIPPNQYYYKEFVPCPADIPVHEAPSIKVVAPCQKALDVCNGQKKAKKIFRIRKKLGNKENSHKTLQRLKRLRGESYVDSKGRERPARSLKEAPCRGKPKHKGCHEVTDDDRKLIYTEFRQLKSNQAQWQFIASHLLIHVKKRNTGGTNEKPSRREYTYVYYLTARGVMYKVCREFFLATLSITESLIKTSLNKLSPQGVCQDDRRGRKTPQNKLSQDDEDYIRRHILSFPTLSRKNSMKKYLDASLNVSEMHKMYLNSCIQEGRKSVSLEKYRLIFKEYGLSFLKQKGVKSKRVKSPDFPKEKTVPIPHCQNTSFVGNPSYESSLPQDLNTSDYRPNGEGFNVGVVNTNEDFTLASYIIGVEAAKEYTDKLTDVQDYTTFCSRPNLTDPGNNPNLSLSSVSNKSSMQPEMNDFSSQDKSFSTDSTNTASENDTKKRKLLNRAKLHVSRLQKLRGESYIDTKGKERPARPMKDAPCRGKPKHHSCDSISDEERASIYKEFRQLNSYQAQWQFVASHVTVQMKSRCTSAGPSRREKTFIYYLTTYGEKVKVCREFFLSTLNITESLVKTSVNKLSPQGICQEDKRGRQTPKNKLSAFHEEHLRNHILSFPTTVKKNSSKRFLDPQLSVVEMHRMYITKCIQEDIKPVSVEKYRTVCKEHNLVIPKSKKSVTYKNSTTAYHQPQNLTNSVPQLDTSQYHSNHFINNGIRNYHEYDERTFKAVPDNVTETDLRMLLFVPEGT